VYETPVKHSHRFAGTAKYGFRQPRLRRHRRSVRRALDEKRYLKYQFDEVKRD
jgi:hypothetical protein